MSNVLTVNHLTKTFVKDGKQIIAVNDVSFTVGEQEILGIVGESGSGKSTVASILMGLESMDSGEVLLETMDISHVKGRVRRNTYSHIQMVFQDAVGSFDPRKTIGQSIESAISKLRDLSKEERSILVIETLRDVGLPATYIKKHPHELSGGECQRAALARAIAVNPKILICDEATSALDVLVQARIVDILLHLREVHEMSIIFITHDLPLVSSLTDRILIMNDGVVVESGPTKSVMTNPKSEYTTELLRSVI